MFEKLSFVKLQKAIQDAITDRTGLTCYDAVPLNAPAPFYYVQIVGKEDVSTKVFYRERIRVWLHAIAVESKSSVPIYGLLESLEEAMTDDIDLPEGYEIFDISETGLQTIQVDPTGEKHAILQYEITVLYGFKSKT